MTQRDTMLSWLNDAYAMENNLIQVLESHARGASDHPTIQSRIQLHLEQTRQHAEMVKGCIERLGGNTSALKTGMASITGAVQGVSSAVARDELVKNLLADFASEHLEIASYRSLIAGAQAIGDMDTMRVCEQILREEEDMADWIGQQIPAATIEFLGQQSREFGAAR